MPRKGGGKVTLEMVSKIQELRAAGWERQDIAKEVGISQSAVGNHLNPDMMASHHLSTMKSQQATRISAMKIIGGGIIRCSYPDCSVTDWRIIEIGHPNGDAHLDYGSYGKQGGKFGTRLAFLRAIVYGKRLTDGLNLVCANHNIINEYETERRTDYTDVKVVPVGSITAIDSATAARFCAINALRERIPRTNTEGNSSG